MVFLDALRRLQTNGALPTDTVITCNGGKKVHAHALTLGAMSPVLLAALRPDRFKEGADGELDLSWADAEHVEFAIAFAFAKDADLITGENAMALLHLANRLDFEELRAACEKTLCSLLTSDNAGEILECAEQCNCVALADEARDVRDDRGDGRTISALVKQRRELTQRHDKLLARTKELQRDKYMLKKRLNDLGERIDFETEKAFKEASQARASSSRETADDGAEAAPTYPHAVGRTLVVAPSPQPKKQKAADGALRYDTLGDAIVAARSGDLISLPPGQHEFDAADGDHGYIFKKSVQIVGAGPATVLGEEALIFLALRGRVNVRLANLSIDAREGGDAGASIDVEQGSGVWLDACELRMRSAIRVHKDSTAVLTNCTVRGCESSAVQIDPQAKCVVVLDCCISGCSAGSILYDDCEELCPFYVPGDAGAIEVSAKGFLPIKRNDEPPRPHYEPIDEPSVKLTVRRTTIASNFGHALTLRMDYTKLRMIKHWNGVLRKESSEAEFIWPGKAEVTLRDNILTSNDLAFPDDASLPTGADAEVLMLNRRLIGNERPDWWCM